MFYSIFSTRTAGTESTNELPSGALVKISILTEESVKDEESEEIEKETTEEEKKETVDEKKEKPAEA